MIHDATLKKNSADEFDSGNVFASDSPASSKEEKSFSLSETIENVVSLERASFHTPGHKGRPQAFGREADFLFDLAHDVTELPQLDDLSHPTGVLAHLESRLATLFNARHSFISTNGASACVIAALMAAAAFGKRILVPTNLHRSALSGMTYANLEPIWYEPVWNSTYGLFEHVQPETFERLLDESNAQSLFVVSPTYGGAMSDISAIASICKQKNVLLIVDEAHGAHLLSPESMPISALECGADIVIHSLHKTLPALTQTGVLHCGHDSGFALEHLRNLLTSAQSSSPSYQLMASIDETVKFLSAESGRKRLADVLKLAINFRSQMSKMTQYEVYENTSKQEPFHVLLRARFEADLGAELRARGIGYEAEFNQAVLFLFGIGNESQDVEILLAALEEIAGRFAHTELSDQKLDAPPIFKQAVSPSQVLNMASHVVPIESSVGCVAMDCIAPCPPGTPVVVPGQLISRDTIEYVIRNTGIRSIRVAPQL